MTPPGTRGTIGTTLCPGRKGSSAAGGRRDRDLGIDLEAIRVWGADLGISLVEEHEFAGLQVPNFRKAVAESGIPWAYAPIPDGGLPDGTFAKAWDAIGPRARNFLRHGGRVIIHCRAGLGRTGTIAALLLVDFGMESEAEIATVRASRPHTIETKNQEAQVMA